MIHLPHIAQRMFNVPVAILPEKAEIIVSVLSGRFGISQLERADGTVIQLQGSIASNVHAGPKEVGYDIEQGVAIIPVTGTLVHKNGYLYPMSGMTGYDAIRHNFSAALNDAQVKGIVFDIDSGGGEVAGCFDLVDEIYSMRGEKPMMAILSEMACSAAYAIASACDVVTVPRTGMTGSVGVVAMHVDQSARLEKEGMRVTMVHYGARKVDGNEIEPLSSDGLKKLQEMVNETGKLFVETVARNRGISAKKVRETEAACFYGAAGVEVGFADGVNAPCEAFSEMLKLIS